MAPDEHLAVGLDRHAIHHGIRSDAGVKAGVQRAVTVQPRDSVAHRAVDRGEVTPDQHLAVSPDRHGPHPVIGPDAGVKVGVQCAVAVQPRDGAAHQAAVERVEVARDQHLAVGLDRQGVDRVVCPGAGVKAGVQRAVTVQPRDAVAACAVDRGEVAPDERLAVGLDRHGIHQDIRPGAGVKAGVQRAIGVQPRDAIAPRAVDCGKVTPDQDLAVGLDRYSPYPAIRPSAGIKAGVQRAVTVQPGDAVAPRAIDRGEVAPDQHLAVGLGHHS